MDLTARQRANLETIIDTFVPEAGPDVPSGTSRGAVDVVVDLISRNPRDAETRQLAQLLSLWDNRAFGLLATGRPSRFSRLDQAGREAFLLRLADSRLGPKRAIFQGLRQASLAGSWLAPGAEELLRSLLGYDAALEARQDLAPRLLAPATVTSDQTLDCDVVVVGSGAGGGTAAATLAEAGLDVIVLERGAYYEGGDFTGREYDGLTRRYAGAPTATAEGQVALVSGEGLGGGTVINYSTCFKTPDHVREEWAGLGAAQFASDEYDKALDSVWQRIGVNGDHSRAARRDVVLERGLTALGWQVGAMTRNVVGCDQDIECGRCGWGCRIGAKQSVDRTWLVDAQAAGARIFTGVDVRRVIAEGAERGVEGVTADGHRVRVRARAVVVAGGTLQTPAILRRSGLGNANVGRYLRLHPVAGVWSRYDEEVLPWTGGMQTRYSTQFGDLDGDGYGVLMETAPFTPGFVAGLTPWRGARENHELMGSLRNATAIAVITRDRDSGQVKVGKDGEPTVHYKLSTRDAAHLRQGTSAAIRISEAAGAQHVLTGHASMPQWRRESGESIDDYVARVERLGHRPGQLIVASLHIMGTARMGGDPGTSATNPDGEVWGTSNVVVADASCFPTAPGVNPMVSIEAIARMNALRLAARLT